MRELTFEDVNRVRRRAGFGPLDPAEPGFVPSSSKRARSGYKGPTVRCPSEDAGERCWHLQGHDGNHEDKLRADARHEVRKTAQRIHGPLPGRTWVDPVNTGESMITFKVKRAENGEFYWTIVAANGETLSSSETYKNKADAEHAVEVVKDGAAGADVDDET